MNCFSILGIVLAGGVGLAGIIFDWTLGRVYNKNKKARE